MSPKNLSRSIERLLVWAMVNDAIKLVVLE